MLDLALPEAADVMGSRTAGAAASEVVDYAKPFLEGLAAQGVAGCGKHFPGLGGASGDTHLLTPSIHRTWNQLWREDLFPYRELHSAMPMIMVNHAAYPDTPGKDQPASVSPFWMTTVLRKRIGYKGIVFSDDFEMGGILNYLSIEEAVVAAFRAGIDIVEICHSPELILRAYEALIREAERSSSFRTLLLERAAAVTQRKQLFSASPTRALTPKQFESLRRRILKFTDAVGINAAGSNRRTATQVEATQSPAP